MSLGHLPQRRVRWELAVLGIGVSLGWAPAAQAQTPYCAVSGLAPAQQAGGVIQLGRQRDRPYVVAVPGQDEQVLTRIKLCFPEAFITTSQLGPYIHVGRYDAPAEAQFAAQWLRSQRLDARVVYRP